MLKRLGIYCKEMFPIPMHLFLGFIVFFEIYLILLLNYGVTEFNIGIQEIIGSLTLFVFLFFLRIVDDFKDYETDMISHPERPLPSGRVKKKDLIVLGVFLLLVTATLNFIYMNNVIFFAIVILYGAFMSVWFCYSERLQKNFILMMFTHTPYLLFMNIYVISFTCIKYGLDAISYVTFFLAFTIYFIGFIRGIAREIKGPKNEIGTTSKFRSYKNYSLYVGILVFLDTITNIILLWNLNIISIGILIISLIWMLAKIKQFIKEPERFKIFDKAIVYVLVQESVMILSGVIYLLIGKI